MLSLLTFIEDTPIYYSEGKNALTFFCIHGAGLSAMSFALLARNLTSFASCASYDLPGHGLHKSNGSSSDLSMENLYKQAFNILREIIRLKPESTIVLLGHSLGGSIAAMLANKLGKEQGLGTEGLKKKVCGLVIIDVVEGSAIEALPFMRNMVLNRPSTFDTVEEGIAYIYKSHAVSNKQSARLSTPSLLMKSGGKLIWRTDLLKTEPYWESWF